jgi:RHS repeat-associated protein
MRTKLALLFLLIFNAGSWAQTTIFDESMGSPTGTVAIAANSFQNSGTLAYANGGQTSAADIRITSSSSGYAGYTGAGNVFFSATSGTYGFSIESINASNYSSLTLQYGYKKEAASVHASFSVDYWNGTSWIILANSASALFNEAPGASAVWYLSKTLAIPTDGQINGLKLRFVKTGTTSIRIDDVKLTGIEIVPSVTNTSTSAITSNAITFAGNVSATGGSAITATGTVYSITATNANPVLSGSGVTTISTSNPNAGTGTFSNSSGTVLLPNVQYSYNAFATKSTGLTGYGTVATFYTLASTPTAPIVGSASGNSLNVAIGSDTNPAVTTYAILETTSSNYVQANGTLGVTAVYLTASIWGTKSVIGLSTLTTYTFKVVAKNGAGVTTTALLSASGTTLELPTLTTTGTLSALTTTYGTASAFSSFSVAGANLTDDVVISAPSGFEISKTSGGSSGYATTQTLTPVSGTISATIIYVRLAANTPFGTYSGNITVVSTHDGLIVTAATVSSPVAKLGLTVSGVTALNKVYDGTTLAILSGTPVLNGVLSGDIANVTLVTTSATVSFADAAIGTGKIVTVTGYTLNGSTSGNYDFTHPLGLTANITANNSSDVVFNSSSSTSTNTNINYTLYQGSTLTNTSSSTGGSIGVMGFYLRDGGVGLNDADNLNTELGSITFDVSHSSNIRSARLFVGNSPKGTTVTVSNGSLTFTGLTDVIASDNSQLAINLRVTFNATVTDNEQLQFTIISATTNSAGSQFALANAGGAISTLAGDINRIEVIASKLQFLQQPPGSLYVATTINPYPTVAAKDENGNTDLDYTGSVSIISSGSLTISPQTATANTGIASFDTIIHTEAGIGLTLTASASGLASAVSNLFDMNSLIIATFDEVAPICFGSDLQDLPTTSINGITGIWTPALNNFMTTEYTFTPNAGQNAAKKTLTLVVNPEITPTFDAIADICFGATLANLPITSTNGIDGTWSPVPDNTVTTIYTFTPRDNSQCILETTLTITVNPQLIPTFDEVQPICPGHSTTALPGTSLEGITGLWSPALDITTTTTYTFTPDIGQCAATAEHTITVNQNVVPTFSEIAPLCSGTSENVLSTTSLEGITGIWSPEFDPTQTTIYTFVPDTNQCAESTSLTVVVNPSVDPLFDEVAPICLGGTLSNLPTTSLNGITGTWSPDLDETVTTAYTFTPDEGQCARITTLTIVVNPNVPSFDPVTPICAGGTLNNLPTTSTNGFTGVWSPDLDNMTTTTYTFVPDEGQCASITTLNITVNANTPIFDIGPICSSTILSDLPSTSTNGVTGVWSMDNSVPLATYTFTPDAGQCATNATVMFTATQDIIPTFDEVTSVTIGGMMTELPTTSTNGIEGIWSPELNNMETTTYAFTPYSGQCATTTTLAITIKNYGGVITPPPPATEPTGGSHEVGTLSGDLSVSSSGSAIYNVPIAVPPGINGVMPQVGLSYNSQSGFGAAGYGWNITGLSTITRIPATKFHDDTIDPVDFDSNDRYALDGQRLMLKSGTYGAANSVYETENFSNTKVTFYGTHFKVEYPDGTQAIYGVLPDSKVGVLTYALKFWSNPQGVIIIYTYTQTNNTLYINSIKYGNTSGSGTQLNDIQFIYKNRNRPEQVFVGGMSIKNEKVLSEIRVIGNGVGFRNYILSHDVVFGYERLKSITETNGDKSRSYNPTVFEYDQNNSSGITSFEKPAFLEAAPNCNPSAPSDERYYNGDFDGDGDPDLIYGNKLFTKLYDNAAVPTIQCVVDLANPHGGYGSISNDAVRCLEQSPNGYNIMNRDAMCHVQRNYASENYKTLNINVYAKNLVSNIMVEEYSKKVIMAQYIETAKTGDFNGDALSDYIFIDGSGLQNPHFYFFNLDRRIPDSNSVTDLGTIDLGSSYNKISTGDFNGDGKTDIICLSGNNTIKIYTLEGNSLVLLWQTPFTFIHPGSKDLFREVITYNCHHVPNWVYFCCQKAGDCIQQPAGTNVSYYCINTDQYNRPQYDRSGWLDISTESVCDHTVYNYPFIIGDFNSDGNSDILLPGLERTVLMSTGISFENEGLPSIYPPAHDLGTGAMQTDYNNDGKSDLLTIKKLSANQFSINDYQRISKGNWINNSSVTYTRSLGSAQNMSAHLVMVLPSKVNLNKPQLLAFEKYFTNHPNGSYTSYPGKAFFYTNENSFTTTRLIKSVTLGNGVKETISYRPLTGISGIYTSAGQITTYPNYDIANSTGMKVVSQIEKQSFTSYKRQSFKYYGYTTNVEGLGSFGFRAITKTNWFSAISTVISNVTKFDMNYRGAPSESFSVLGSGAALPITILQPTDPYISKTIYSYNNNNADNPLLPNKVFKVRNTFSQNFDGFTETITDVSSEYDAYNLKKRTSLIHSNNSTESKSIMEDYIYDDLPAATIYFIGRPKNKKVTATLTASGDESVVEEDYTYNYNLLTQTKRRSKNSGETSHYVSEINGYDFYGNIISTTISAPDATPSIANRTSTFIYDSSHRFMTKATDAEGLQTDYTYDMSKGLVLSETLPSIVGFPLKTTFTYDTWGKKIKSTNFLGSSAAYTFTDTYVNIIGGVQKTTVGNDGSSSKLILDDLGRKIHEQVKDINDKWSCVTATYDFNDRPLKITQPYFVTGISTGSFTAWNEMQYDAYGRLIKSNTLKSNSSNGKEINYSYDALTIHENEGARHKDIVKDIFGNVVSLDETGATGVTYTYFANGNLKTTTSGNAVTTITQDGWGRKKSLDDPSAGVYNYTYNDFNELVSEEVVGKGITNYNMNNVGKISSKVVTGYTTDTPTTTTTYTYDGVTKLLTSMIFSDPTNNNIINYAYNYDNFKRIKKTTEKRNSFFEFQKEYLFDNFGRTEKEHSYAKDLTTNKVSEKWIKTTFKNGEKWQMYDMLNSTSTGSVKLWQTDTYDAGGNILTAALGNGITITNSFDPYGFPKTISHDKGATNIIALKAYFNHSNGNMTRRKYSLFNWDETLAYDNLDRLLTYKDPLSTNPTALLMQSYNGNGTIAANNIGNFGYTQSDKPYRPTSITPTDQSPASAVITYYTGREQNIGYNVFKSPAWITEQGKENIDFEYNALNNRSVMFYGNEQVTKASRSYRKFYSADGSMEIKRRVTGSVNEFVTYIGGDGYTAPIVLKSNGTSQNYFYLHRDYQGSILAITSSTGAVVEKRLFDVWGALIKYDAYSVTTPPVTSTGLFLDRGYSGHEHLLGVGLINMNGRIYDPKLHKFLQPDNYIQDPNNTQNYNRYGYCLNNPTKYSDPSGETGQDVAGGGWGGPEWGSAGMFYSASFLSGFMYQGALNNNFNNPYGNNTYGGHLNGPPPATTYSVTNFSGGYQDTYSFSNNLNSGGISGMTATPFVYGSTGLIQMPTQHSFLGINMTALSEGNFLEQTIYGVANQANIVAQFFMFRSVGDSSMRNLNGTGTTTGEGALAFGTLPLYFTGVGEAAGGLEASSAGSSGAWGKAIAQVKSTFSGWGKTFSQYKASYWAGRAKPILDPIINRETGQVWKQFMELHHRFIPQRWNWPNWLTNNRFNLKPLNSLEHAKVDPYRARFAPQWVKDMFNLTWK